MERYHLLDFRYDHLLDFRYDGIPTEHSLGIFRFSKTQEEPRTVLSSAPEDHDCSDKSFYSLSFSVVFVCLDFVVLLCFALFCTRDFKITPSPPPGERIPFQYFIVEWYLIFFPLDSLNGLLLWFFQVFLYSESLWATDWECRKKSPFAVLINCLIDPGLLTEPNQVTSFIAKSRCNVAWKHGLKLDPATWWLTSC